MINQWLISQAQQQNVGDYFHHQTDRMEWNELN